MYEILISCVFYSPVNSSSFFSNFQWQISYGRFGLVNNAYFLVSKCVYGITPVNLRELCSLHAAGKCPWSLLSVACCVSWTHPPAKGARVQLSIAIEILRSTGSQCGTVCHPLCTTIDPHQTHSDDWELSDGHHPPSLWRFYNIGAVYWQNDILTRHSLHSHMHCNYDCERAKQF